MESSLESKDSNILEFSIEQLKNILKRVAENPKLHVVGITSEQYDRALGLETNTSQIYPYMTVLPSEIDDDNESYNRYVLKLKGPTTKYVKGYKFVSHLVPINFEVAVSYFTQSTKDLLQFIQRWKYNYRNSTFVLRSKDNFSVRIRVHLEPHISFPNKNLETGECYKLDCRMTLHTYAGYVTRVKTIEKTEIIAHIQRTGNYDVPPDDESKGEKVLFSMVDESTQQTDIDIDIL